MKIVRERTPKFHETVRVLRIGVRSLYRSRLPQMAAALAFRTLFALIPMLVISVAAIGAFAEPEDVRDIINLTFEQLGFNNLDEAVPSGDQVGPVPEESSKPQAAAELNELNQVVVDIDPATDGDAQKDETTIRIEELLTGLIDKILSLPFGAIGAVGVLTLIYASISMLIEIERAFNNVFRAQIGKSWGKRVVQYWTIITLVPILLFAAFYASEQFRGIGVGFAGSVVSVAITALLLLLAYAIIPNTRVHMRTGIVGALVAAILWELAKWGFRQYLAYSVSYKNLYGPLALLPLFMLWVYLTWLIILFGLQVAYGLQHYEAAKRIEEEDAEKRLTDPAAVLGVMAVIAERFTRGKTTGPAVIADELNLQADVLDTILNKLTRAGIVHPVDGALDNYALARPAEGIALEELMAAMGDITDSGHVSNGSWTDAIDRVRQAQLDIIRGETLASLIAAGREVST